MFLEGDWQNKGVFLGYIVCNFVIILYCFVIFFKKINFNTKKRQNVNDSRNQ